MLQNGASKVYAIGCWLRAVCVEIKEMTKELFVWKNKRKICDA